MTKMTIFDTIDGIVDGLLGKKKSGNPGSHTPVAGDSDRGETAAERNLRKVQARRAAAEQSAKEAFERSRKPIFGT